MRKRYKWSVIFKRICCGKIIQAVVLDRIGTLGREIGHNAYEVSKRHFDNNILVGDQSGKKAVPVFIIVDVVVEKHGREAESGW